MLLESRWKTANDRCPYPERWHSTDEESTEIEVSELVAALVEVANVTAIVEVTQDTEWKD